jgi:hypothetical protein
MLTTIIALAMLAGSEGLPAVPDLSSPRTRTSSYSADRMICKYDKEPGSNLKRRKVCLTRAQWDEWQQSERLYLLRNQFNGSPK